METIIINDCNLENKDIDKFGKKVRALLLKDDKVLIAKYCNVVLFPGGSIDEGETADQAILRELHEELGIQYDITELAEFVLLKYYQKNYPTRDNKIVNRLQETKYYIGNYKGINLLSTERTESEKNGNFSLELVKIDDFFSLSNQVIVNPRKAYFDRENSEVIKLLKKFK